MPKKLSEIMEWTAVESEHGRRLVLSRTIREWKVQVADLETKLAFLEEALKPIREFRSAYKYSAKPWPEIVLDSHGDISVALGRILAALPED